MTAPVRSTTVPLIVPVMGSAGPCCGAVAFGAPEGCGDCARAGKEQSRRTPSKGMRGHSQGRLPLPESNLQRVPPKDFLPEPVLAEFTVGPLFTVCPSAYFRQGFDGPDVPKVSTLVFWMTSASFGLDESKGRERFRATPPAWLGRPSTPEKARRPAFTRQGGGSARTATRRRSTGHRTGSRCARPFQGFLRLCICGRFRSKLFRPR